MSTQFGKTTFRAGEVSFGTFSPTHYVVAAFDTEEQAKRTLQALREAEFRAEDVRLWSGAEVLERHQAFLKQQNLLDRVGAVVAMLGTEQEAMQQYLTMAEQGHFFLTVYAPQPELVERAAIILANNQAHATRYYDHWTVADL
jgi:hypothetical protein